MKAFTKTQSIKTGTTMKAIYAEGTLKKAVKAFGEVLQEKSPKKRNKQNTIIYSKGF